MVGNIVPFRQNPAVEGGIPTAAELEIRVHELAKHTTNLRFDHPHFQQRLVQRKISMRQILDVLRQGSVIGGPKKDEWGDWRVKLQRKVSGRRVQIVVAVQERRLDLVTAI